MDVETVKKNSSFVATPNINITVVSCRTVRDQTHGIRFRTPGLESRLGVQRIGQEILAPAEMGSVVDSPELSWKCVNGCEGESACVTSCRRINSREEAVDIKPGTRASCAPSSLTTRCNGDSGPAHNVNGYRFGVDDKGGHSDEIEKEVEVDKKEKEKGEEEEEELDGVSAISEGQRSPLKYYYDGFGSRSNESNENSLNKSASVGRVNSNVFIRTPKLHEPHRCSDGLERKNSALPEPKKKLSRVRFADDVEGFSHCIADRQPTAYPEVVHKPGTLKTRPEFSQLSPEIHEAKSAEFSFSSINSCPTRVFDVKENQEFRGHTNFKTGDFDSKSCRACVGSIDAFAGPIIVKENHFTEETKPIKSILKRSISNDSSCRDNECVFKALSGYNVSISDCCDSLLTTPSSVHEVYDRSQVLTNTSSQQSSDVLTIAHGFNCPSDTGFNSTFSTREKQSNRGETVFQITDLFSYEAIKLLQRIRSLDLRCDFLDYLTDSITDDDLCDLKTERGIESSSAVGHLDLATDSNIFFCSDSLSPDKSGSRVVTSVTTSSAIFFNRSSGIQQGSKIHNPERQRAPGTNTSSQVGGDNLIQRQPQVTKRPLGQRTEYSCYHTQADNNNIIMADRDNPVSGDDNERDNVAEGLDGPGERRYISKATTLSPYSARSSTETTHLLHGGSSILTTPHNPTFYTSDNVVSNTSKGSHNHPESCSGGADAADATASTGSTSPISAGSLSDNSTGSWRSFRSSTSPTSAPVTISLFTTPPPKAQSVSHPVIRKDSRRRVSPRRNNIQPGRGVSKLGQDSTPRYTSTLLPSAALGPAQDTRSSQGYDITPDLLTDLSIPEISEDIPIVHSLYVRAARDLHSKDIAKRQNAELMLQRLRQVGYELEPKSKSTSSLFPGIPTKVTQSRAAPELGRGHRSRRQGNPARKMEDAPSSEVKNAALYFDSLDPQDIMDPNGECMSRKASRSRSDPVLFNNSENTTCFLLDTLESSSVPRRKDSVSHIRKLSSVAAYGSSKRRRSTVSQTYAGTQRRHSLVSVHQVRGNQVQPTDPAVVQEPNFLAWSHLLSTVPREERRNSQIRRQHLVISIPVCLVGKESPVAFTSLDAIEQTLRRYYPDVLVKRRHPSDPLPTDSTQDTTRPAEDGQGERPVSSVQRISPTGTASGDKAIDKSRRMSIDTCIKVMKKYSDDYDQQLLGVKSIGAYADEETLKVLFAKPEAILCVIEAMNAFPDKEELQMCACTSLLQMACASESNCVYILQNDGIPAIIEALRTNAENEDIVGILLNTIAFISTAVDLAAPLVAGGIHSEVLSVMSRHSTNRQIVQESCFIIGNLLTTVETADQLMLVGGVHTIINMADKFPDDPSIQENSCRTLGSFAIYDETCLDVAMAGATETVLKALKALAEHVGVAECGCWALATLTAIESTCVEVVKLGGVAVLLRVMEEHSHEESLQEYGVRVLYNLSDCDETVESVRSKQVASLLYGVLVTFPDSVELLELALVALSQTLHGHESTFQNLVVSRGVLDVVATMMNFPENILIQEHGCKVVGNMAINSQLRKQVEEDGASRAVILAMLTLDTSSDIQEVGCLALMNLTADNKDNKVRMKNAGAVPTLLNTLKTFKHDDNVVLCALKALGNLVGLEEVCHLVLDEQGLDTIVHLVELHASSSDIRLFLAMVLCALSELPDLKEDEVVTVDHTLMNIWECNKSDPDVSLYVCQAIENFIKTELGRQTFLRENRLTVIMDAMTTFPQACEIHRCCCKVIAVAALYVDSEEGLITDNTMQCVLRSMEHFSEDRELQIVGCGTICCLVETSATLAKHLVNLGGIQLIHRAVTSHSMEPRIAVVALMALEHVMPIDQTAYATEAVLAFRTIQQCMNAFSENLEIQMSGCAALSKTHCSENQDVTELIKCVANALRRHGNEEDMQIMAASALQHYYRQQIYSERLVQVINSSTFNLKDIFWTTIKQ